MSGAQSERVGLRRENELEKVGGKSGVVPGRRRDLEAVIDAQEHTQCCATTGRRRRDDMKRYIRRAPLDAVLCGRCPSGRGFGDREKEAEKRKNKMKASIPLIGPRSQQMQPFLQAVEAANHTAQESLIGSFVTGQTVTVRGELGMRSGSQPHTMRHDFIQMLTPIA